MTIQFSDDFTTRNLQVSLGILRAKVCVKPSNPVLLEKLDQTAQARLNEFNGQPASTDPQIWATRKAYKAFGKDPARYRPAAEALTRRVLQGKGLYHVNNVVDVNNLISVKSGLSIGTYTYETINGTITFRRANAGESYQGIGRGDLNLEGLPVFSDDLGPFGCPTSDSERTMVKEGEHEILMVLICFDPTLDLSAWLDETQTLLKDHCGAHDVQKDIVRTP